MKSSSIIWASLFVSTNECRTILYKTWKIQIEKSTIYPQPRFSVGAFSFEGKMPDSYRDLFFLQTTDLTLIGLLFTETSKTTQAKSSQCKPSAKSPPLDFFGTVRLFSNIFMSQKSPPFEFFDTLQQNVC